MTEKKHKPAYFRQLKDEITRVDENTFYARSDSEPDKEPYMIFNSDNIGWVCDCMSFVMSMTDTTTNPPCKHILRIKRQYNL